MKKRLSFALNVWIISGVFSVNAFVPNIFPVQSSRPPRYEAIEAKLSRKFCKLVYKLHKPNSLPALYDFAKLTSFSLPGIVGSVTFNTTINKIILLHANENGVLIVSEMNQDGTGLRYLFDSPDGIGESITYVPSNCHYFLTRNGNGSSDLDRLYEVDMTGNVVNIITTPSFGSPNPSGVVYHPQRKTLFVSDIVADKVFEITLDGQLLNQWTTHWDIDHISYVPIGITYDPANGSLFILDITNAAQGFIAAPTGELVATTSYAFIEGRPSDFTMNPLNRYLYAPNGTFLDVWIPQ